MIAARSTTMLLLAAIALCGLQAQSSNRELFKLHIQRTAEPIKIDGILDERAWLVAERAVDFHRVTPIDTGQALSQTVVMMAFDDQEIYMAIICYDAVVGPRPAESLRRDFSFGRNDNFLVFIDTYNDRTNGFSFGTSAAGAQWDGIQADGGFVSLDWDCKWRSAITSDDEKWVAEFAIPFRSIRYADGIKEWGINFSRLDLKTNEKSTWAPVPRQFQSANLAFTGTLAWPEEPPKLGTRFSVIPYAAVRAFDDRSRRDDRNLNASAGVDAKVTVSTSMNLDLTFNPDFSQVEVDQQVTNLDRFELFFPERRQFFLENSDLFASLGDWGLRPFFSRRIGLNTRVWGGLRLSGKLDEDWRVGLLNMQTASADEAHGNNFTVAALQRKIGTRSNLTGFAVNKSATGPREARSATNTVAGLDYNFSSPDSRWTGKTFYHQLFSPVSQGAFAASADVQYSSQQLNVSLLQAYVDKDYQAETGFVRRTGYYRLNPTTGYLFYPSREGLISHGPSADVNVLFGQNSQLTDREVELGYEFNWLNRSSLSFFVYDQFVRLLDAFDPTNTNAGLLPEGSTYQWNEVEINYNSDGRKLFNYRIGLLYGGYYTGKRTAAEIFANYRIQPYGSLGLVASWNALDLPQPFGLVNLYLLGPKLDITFTDRLFLTTFVQYNSQIENLNLNFRLQWRYAPVSDFFFVYTTNAQTLGPWTTRDQSVVAKVSYYFN